MRVKFLIAVIGMILFASCSKTEGLYEPPTDQSQGGTSTSDTDIDNNVHKVFGVTFDENHEWCTTSSRQITINANSSIKKVQVLVYLDAIDEEGEPITDLNVMNEAELNGKTSVTLTYDEPYDNKGVFVSFISDDDIQLRKVTGSTVSLDTKAGSRGTALSQHYDIPTTTPTIGKIIDSYAKERGWIEDEKLYALNDYNGQKMLVDDYTEDEKETLRALILSYFVNSKSVNNLNLINESGFKNATGYPITTQEGATIIISPMYKCDGCLKTSTGYGYEVHYSDLYYYYFKEDDPGYIADPVGFMEKLPKYKAIQFSDIYPKTEDDILTKKGAFALIYWGEGKPAVGTEGSYYWPKDLKIGFMLRSTTDGENKTPDDKKKGELYTDGRLNSKINNHGSFASSKLPADAPRSAWLTVNGKQFLCWESGTDKDYNDLIIEIQGGVSELTYTPKMAKNQVYTFCFEDTRLGDYDMNDVVIKAKRINDTQVQYEIIACGAYNELFIKNVDPAWENTEVHELFGKKAGTFINTVIGEEKLKSVTIKKNVSSTFTLLDRNSQPYIYDKTTDSTTKLATKGQDPHGIMIPSDFKYPCEKVCIKDAYKTFNDWGQNSVSYTNWYTKPTSDKVYK